MANIIGREITVKRGLLVEKITIDSIKNITSNIYSVTGHNAKKRITVTMLKEELHLLLGGTK